MIFYGTEGIEFRQILMSYRYRLSLFTIGLFLILSASTFAQGVGRSPQDIDFDQRLSELLALPQTQSQSQQIAVLFRMWSRFKPEEAYQALHTNSLPDSLPLGVMEGMAISSWLKIDPEPAMQAAINSSFPENLDLAFRMYAHQDSEAAFDLAKSLGSQVTLDTWTGIIEGAASWNPNLAANYVLELGPQGEELIGGFIYLYSTQDPGGAIDWLIQHYPSSKEHHDALVARYYAINPDEATVFINDLPESRYKQALLVSLDRAEKITRGEYP